MVGILLNFSTQEPANFINGLKRQLTIMFNASKLGKGQGYLIYSLNQNTKNAKRSLTSL